MKDFTKFNKKQEFINLPEANFEFGKKVRLAAPLSFYNVGEEFTVVGESTPSFEFNVLGIGETYLKDSRGSVLLINGSKKSISNIFENIEEPKVVIQEIKEEPKPLLAEDIKLQLKKELTQQLREELKPLPGPKGDRGDRGLPGMPGDNGERGDVGERGETGWTGWPGDKGEPGKDGEKGEKGDNGDKGDKGDTGEKGDQGPQGEQGSKGDQGPQGIQGEKGDKGERGDRGDIGLTGEKGDTGEPGEKGDKGDKGDLGLPGKDGEDGERGEKGEKGDKGDTGQRGEKGDKGEPGDTGLLSVSYPLAYEDLNKHLSLDTKFLEEFNNKVTTEISKHAYGSGGGGNVDLYIEGEKAVKNLRSINFTGDGVSVTPDGIKATVNIAAVAGPQGPTGQSTGRVLYLNYSESSDISGYKVLSQNLTQSSEQTLTTLLPTYNSSGYQTDSIINFITQSGYPNQTKLDPGIWDVTLYANVDSDTGGRECYLFTRLYKRSAIGIETEIARSDNSPKITTSLLDYSFQIAIRQPVLLDVTDRLFLEVYAVHRGNSHNIVLYFEGTNHYSHVHTNLNVDGGDLDGGTF